MIRTLNIDGMFVPIPKPEIAFNIIKFSGGELHVKLRDNIDYNNIEKVIITNRINSTDELMKVLIVKDALERKGIKRFDLVMPYIPYARQDRQCADGESFTLKVFTNILNTANFDNVHVFDAHSDVSPALINNCHNWSNKEYVEASCKDIGHSINLVSPDSGANKKTNKLFEETNCFTKIIKCDKKRDLSNGKLSGFEVFADDLNNEDCLIVDDICDGGKTFIGIAEELKKKNAGDIFLFVTHGIFSNGLEELSKYFKKIYSSNSFRDIQHDNLKQFKLYL